MQSSNKKEKDFDAIKKNQKLKNVLPTFQSVMDSFRPGIQNTRTTIYMNDISVFYNRKTIDENEDTNKQTK